MDLYKAIRTLHEERERLDKLIQSITEMRARGAALRPAARPRRGRRKMSAAQRREVSERMKRYWASRRVDASTLTARSPFPAA